MEVGFYHNKHELDVHVGHIQRLVDKGLRDGEVRQLAVKIVSGRFDTITKAGEEHRVVRAWGKYFLAPPGPVCKTQDDECEIEKIWDFVVLNIRYVADTSTMDVFATLKESLIAGGGDCFPEGTLLLTDFGELKPIEQICVGETIWGYDQWTRVEAVAVKGEKPITGVRLNNGSWLQLTEEHKVYVGRCDRHSTREASPPCSCPLAERRIERIRVAELQVDDVLLQPEQIKSEGVCAAQGRDQAINELIGFYLADGWVDESRICIAGKDGHPKEAQKHYIAGLCRELGIETSWHRRYIRVHDAELARQFSKLGRRAPQKHMLDNDVLCDERSARAFLKGLLADSGKNASGGLTYSTTSRTLALQTRLLYRQLGISCSLQCVEKHGGLGQHPIYRLVPRQGERGQHKLLRVKEIDRNLPPQFCYDIQTSDNYVYLPEHDVTVSNCDDLTIAFATLLGSLGFTVLGRVVSLDTAPKDWAHIFPLVGIPKEDPKKWVALDASVPGSSPGWIYPKIAKHKDYLLTVSR